MKMSVLIKRSINQQPASTAVNKYYSNPHWTAVKRISQEDRIVCTTDLKVKRALDTQILIMLESTSGYLFKQ